jgi:HK97 family phage portal protein
MKMLDRVMRKGAEWIIRNLPLDHPAMLRHFGHYDNASGQVVNEHTALGLSAAWSCVRLIAGTVGTLPYPTYRQNGQGYPIVARDHWLYTLLAVRPNAIMTPAEFWESMTACLLLYGNAYALKEFSGFGAEVDALYPLRPDHMKVERNDDGFLKYTYRDPVSGEDRVFAEEQILHIKGFSLDGLVGLSPIAAARHSLGNAMSIEATVGHTFRNGLRPSGVVSTKQLLRKDQRADARDWIEKQVAGMTNAGKLLFLEAGMEYSALSIPPADAQMLESRGFAVEEICRIFGVPPHMVGHMSKSTSWGTGLETQIMGFHQFGLRPNLVRIEQACARSLVPQPERGRIWPEFKVEGLLRADSQGRAALYAAFADHGVMTRNEIRALENLPPIAGGDDLTIQSNLIPARLLGQITSTAQQQEPVP